MEVVVASQWITTNSLDKQRQRQRRLPSLNTFAPSTPRAKNLRSPVTVRPSSPLTGFRTVRSSTRAKVAQNKTSTGALVQETPPFGEMPPFVKRPLLLQSEILMRAFRLLCLAFR